MIQDKPSEKSLPVFSKLALWSFFYLRGYGTLKYGDVHEKFNFLEIQDLRPLRTCQKHFETIMPYFRVPYHLNWSEAAILGNSAVVRTRPRAIPLAMITMRKSSHGFPFVYGAPLGRRSSAIMPRFCKFYVYRQRHNLAACFFFL